MGGLEERGRRGLGWEGTDRRGSRDAVDRLLPSCHCEFSQLRTSVGRGPGKGEPEAICEEEPSRP